MLCGGAMSARGAREKAVGLKSVRIAVAIIIASGALVFAAVQFVSGSNLRSARLALLKKDVPAAISHLNKANALTPSKESRYIAGSVALFDLKRPDLAVGEFLKLEKEFCGGYIHSYGLTARALFAMGKHQEAKEFFQLERKAFPFSALYAGFELAALQMSSSAKQELTDASARFERNLKLRDLDLSTAAYLRKNPDFDDRPLKWSKKP